MSIPLRDGLSNQSLDHILEDLLVRFVVNLPEEDLSSIERIMFPVEEAQWFYTDYIRSLNPDLPPMKMKPFSSKLLEKCPLIWKWGDPQEALSKFGKYKSIIPVRGAALLNSDLTKMVLVKGTESNTWSFPRGKISKDESDIDCAVREVVEETGYDCRDSINEQDSYERTIRGKSYKIYFIKNVKEDTEFIAPKYEIQKIKWFDIKSIQRNKKDLFLVDIFQKPLMKWINQTKGLINEQEVMLQVESKLKSLMGLVPQQNEDAGRDLLNILQKKPITYQEPVNNVLPQQPPPPPQTFPLFSGDPTIPSDTKAREFLSILRAPQNSHHVNLPPNQDQINHQSTFPLKQQLNQESSPLSNPFLNILKAPSQSSSSVPSQQPFPSLQPIQQQLQAQSQSQHPLQPQPKIKLLKREPNQQPSASPVSQPQPRHQSTSTSANQLLSLLQKKKTGHEEASKFDDEDFEDFDDL